MTSIDKALSTGQQENFMQSLLAFTREHKATYWSGSLAQFLEKILPAEGPRRIIFGFFGRV